MFKREGFLPTGSASKSTLTFQMGIQIAVGAACREEIGVQLLCLLSVGDLSNMNPELGWMAV